MALVKFAVINADRAVKLLSEAIPYIEGLMDGSEWDERAADLADEIRDFITEINDARERLRC